MTYTQRLLLLLFFFLNACKAPYTAVSHHDDTRQVRAIAPDSLSAVELLLKPYREQIAGQMQEVIGRAEGDFIREKPSGSLGNLVVDALLFKAQQVDPRTVNAISNYGGIRLNQVPRGDITVGRMFELLPFENELVLIEVNGAQLKQWIELMAKAGGWPVARYLPFRVEENRAGISYSDTLLVYDQMKKETLRAHKSHPPLLDTARFLIATNDYVANGGDQCEFLKACPQLHTGLLVRDAVTDYVRVQQHLIPDSLPRFKLKNP